MITFLIKVESLWWAIATCQVGNKLVRKKNKQTWLPFLARLRVCDECMVTCQVRNKLVRKGNIETWLPFLARLRVCDERMVNLSGTGGLPLIGTGDTFPAHKTLYSIHCLKSFLSFQTFYFVLNKIKNTKYIKYSSTICGLAVGPLVETGHARIVIRAVAVSQAEFTNC